MTNLRPFVWMVMFPIIGLITAREMISTDKFIQPISLAVGDDQTLIFTRNTPLGTVAGRWFAEVVPLNGQPECNSAFWRVALYQQTDQIVRVIKTDPQWSADCLIEENLPFSLTIVRQAKLGGIIPLKSSVQSVTITEFVRRDGTEASHDE